MRSRKPMQRTNPPKNKAELGFRHRHRTELDADLSNGKKSFSQARTNLFNAVSVVEGKSHKRGKFVASYEHNGVFYNVRGKSWQQARDNAEKELRRKLL